MTYNGLDIFEGKIKSNDEGIFAISLVDDPAIDIDFVCFSKDKNIVKFSIQSEEERIITGPIMIPDYPIIRSVDGYRFYVKYSRETIKEMAEKMLKDGTFNNIDIQHNMQLIDGLSLVELYIKDSKKGIVPSFLQNIPDGTLIASYHIENDILWDSVKNGKLLNGFSLAGRFDFEGLNNKIIKRKEMKIVEKFIKTIVKFAQISTDKGMLLTNEGEDLAVGVEVFIEDGEEYKKADDGEYKLDDEKVIVVVDGKVSEIREVEKEDEVKDVEDEVIVNAADSEEEIIVNEEPKEDERDAVKEQIDALRSEIDALKNEIAELKNTLSNIVSKPAVEPIVEEFEKVKNIEVKGNKAAKLLANLRK